MPDTNLMLTRLFLPVGELEGLKLEASPTPLSAALVLGQCKDPLVNAAANQYSAVAPP